MPDYGHGVTNIDPTTGIRFGVISQHSILQAWCDESEPYYGEGEKEPDDFSEPISYFFKDSKYSMETCLDSDVMVLKSPFYTFSRLCSPCVPGAGDLNSPCDADEGVKAYCPGHDWFDGGKAPYPVYRVSDGKEEIEKGE